MKTSAEKLKEWQEIRAVIRKASDSISALEHALAGKTPDIEMPEAFKDIFKGFKK